MSRGYRARKRKNKIQLTQEENAGDARSQLGGWRPRIYNVKNAAPGRCVPHGLFFFRARSPFDSLEGPKRSPQRREDEGRREACLVARLLQRDAYFPVDPFHSSGDPLPRGPRTPSRRSPHQRAPRKPGGMVQTTRSAGKGSLRNASVHEAYSVEILRRQLDGKADRRNIKRIPKSLHLEP